MNTDIISLGRWCGIHAEVFSLALVPFCLRVDRRGTVWQVAAIPLGGYVRFKGDKGAASDDTSALDDMDAAERRSTMHGAPFGRGPRPWRRGLFLTLSYR